MYVHIYNKRQFRRDLFPRSISIVESTFTKRNGFVRQTLIFDRSHDALTFTTHCCTWSRSRSLRVLAQNYGVTLDTTDDWEEKTSKKKKKKRNRNSSVRLRECEREREREREITIFYKI